MTRAAMAAYYVLAPAEASSNLAKYDGVRYGNRSAQIKGSKDVLFSASRGENFGQEVQRRVLLGSFSLSSTAMDNYFVRAQKVRRLVQADFNKSFALKHPLLKDAEGPADGKGVDIIITPTSLDLPPELQWLQKPMDASSTFTTDLCTIPASLAGLPAISVPSKRSNMYGLQVVAQYGDDDLVFRAARELEEIQLPVEEEKV